MLSSNERLSPFIKPGVEGLLNPLHPWLNDAQVSEIMINAPGEVFIEKEGEMTQFKVPELTSLYIKRLFQMIANESQQTLDEQHPILAGTLYNGARVQLILPPISRHHTLAIRKASIKQLALDEYQTQGFYQGLLPFYMQSLKSHCQNRDEEKLLDLFQQQDWNEFVKTAIAQRKNIVISGGTSSGKTTFLNACLAAIDKRERVISLEDTRELIIPHANQVSLLTSKESPGKPLIEMQTLLQATLRLRPDRIIMGEIRGKEIMDFVGACSTGHEGSIATIHANNPQIALQRMIQLYKQNNVPSMRDEEIAAELHSVIDIIIQVNKTAYGRQAVSCYYKQAQDIGE